MTKRWMVAVLAATLAASCDSENASSDGGGGPSPGYDGGGAADVPVMADGGAAVDDAAPAAADAATDAPVCPGENPARRCRTSAMDCIPSGCGCTALGWICTADCGGGRFCGDGGGADVASTPAERCRATGGTAQATACCHSTSEYPNSCAVGACGCAPADSHMVTVCSCPPNTCFLPDQGCVPAR
jgi:hypothetical protein